MVAFNFIQEQQEAMAAHVPAEIAHVNMLREQGVVETVYLAADRSGGWIVLHGESPDRVRQTMSTLPLYPFMELQQTTPLLDIGLGRGAAGEAPRP
jgi:hypothetical protein